MRFVEHRRRPRARRKEIGFRREHSVGDEQNVVSSRLLHGFRAVRLAVEDRDFQSRRKARKLLLPVIEDRCGRHDEGGTLLCARQKERDRLHGFAEPHVVRKERTRAPGGEPHEPLEALGLVVAKFRAQAFGHTGDERFGRLDALHDGLEGFVRLERHALFAEIFEKPRTEGGDLDLVLLFFERHAFETLESAAEGFGKRHVFFVAESNEVAFSRADAVQKFGHREDRTVVERDAALHLEPRAQTREAQRKIVKGKRRVPHDDRFAFGPLEHGFLWMCAHGVEKLERFAKRRIPTGVVLAHVFERCEGRLHRPPVSGFGLQVANDLQGFALHVEGDGFFAQTGPAHEPFLHERPNQRRDVKAVALRTHSEGDAGVALLFLKRRRLLQKIREHGRAARETFEILREARLRFGRKENVAALRCRENFALLL